MVMLTVACVALVTCVEVTVMPAPKLATVEPCRKLEYFPATTTASDCPVWPLFGVTVEMLAAGFTVSEAELELWNAVPVEVVPAIVTA
jgi:hypothetical protein